MPNQYQQMQRPAAIELRANFPYLQLRNCVRGGIGHLRHGSWSGDWGADRFGQASAHVFRSIATPRSSPIGRPAVGTGLKRNTQRSKQDRKEPPIGDCSDKFD